MDSPAALSWIGLALDEAPCGDRAEYRTSQGRAADGEQPTQGERGRQLNAVLSAAAMNFAKLLGVLGAYSVCRSRVACSLRPGGALAAPAG